MRPAAEGRGGQPGHPPGGGGRPDGGCVAHGGDHGRGRAQGQGYILINCLPITSYLPIFRKYSTLLL